MVDVSPRHGFQPFLRFYTNVLNWATDPSDVFVFQPFLRFYVCREAQQMDRPQGADVSTLLEILPLM
ncbi:MAG: hypothetical protein ACO2PM_03775 [Pyrobaculum sp.]